MSSEKIFSISFFAFLIILVLVSGNLSKINKENKENKETTENYQTFIKENKNLLKDTIKVNIDSMEYVIFRNKYLLNAQVPYINLTNEKLLNQYLKNKLNKK